MLKKITKTLALALVVSSLSGCDLTPYMQDKSGMCEVYFPYVRAQETITDLEKQLVVAKAKAVSDIHIHVSMPAIEVEQGASDVTISHGYFFRGQMDEQQEKRLKSIVADSCLSKIEEASTRPNQRINFEVN